MEVVEAGVPPSQSCWEKVTASKLSQDISRQREVSLGSPKAAVLEDVKWAQRPLEYQNRVQKWEVYESSQNKGHEKASEEEALIEDSSLEMSKRVGSILEASCFLQTCQHQTLQRAQRVT